MPRPIVLLFLATLSWSLTGVLVKGNSWDPLALTCVASLCGAAVQCIYARRIPFKFTAAALAASGFYAGLLLACIVSMKLTTAANAILLQFTSPVFAALFDWLLYRQRPSRADMVTFATVGIGLAVFFSGEVTNGHWLGNSVALLSGAFAAANALSLRKVPGAGQVHTVLCGNIVLFLVCLPFLWRADFTLLATAQAALLGALGMGLGWVLYAVAIPSVTAVQALLITTPEAVLNPIFVLLIIGEQPSLTTVIGGSIVLCAVVSYGLRTARESATERPAPLIAAS